jgi:hypothetical protein
MNWSIIGFIVLIWLIIIAFGVMIYFEYIDPLRRQAQWQREQENKSYTLASDGYPAVTWLLDARFRELSDTEIADALYVADITLNNLSDGDIPIERINAFARAVIRKAQEKE